MLLTIKLPRVARGQRVSNDREQWCVYVSIAANNAVTIASPVMDMGQHMKTTGPMIMADEMDLDWSLVEVADECPTYLVSDAGNEVGYRYADMGTGGSHAVRRNWDYMRRAGATARRMLIEEAAERWQLTPDSLTARRSFVVHPPSNRRLAFGDLAERAAQREINPANVQLKTVDQYDIMGRDIRTVDIRQIVTGKPLFGIDAEYPSALQAVIQRAPKQGATVDRYDRRAAVAVPGVLHVVEMERLTDTYRTGTEKQIVSSGVAVVAKSLWSAMKGKQALNATWNADPDWENQSSDGDLARFRRRVASDEPAKRRKEDGDIEGAFAQARQIVDQTYETPLFAHACMEPFSCIADIRRRDASIVIGHQFPHQVAETVSQMTGIDSKNVEVINRRMGGGFGRRAETDYLREAVVLSQHCNAPVKVTWMREDEVERDYFAPAYVMRVKASLDQDNRVSGWLHRQAQTRGGCRDACFPANVVKNYRSEHFEQDSVIPTGPWRGPGHLQWTFATESMIDELAIAAKQDPLEFRLALMRPHRAYSYDGWGAETIDSGRMAVCYEKAAELAQWGQARPHGHGLGIAGHFTFGSYAAFVVEVSMTTDHQLTIHEAWGAIDCGFAINPNHIRNQMEGGFIDGVNAALFNKVDIIAGHTRTNNFHTLRWMRMKEAPVSVQTHIVKNDYPPTGVGEPPTAPAAAALANALFAASGKRFRNLPLATEIKI